MACTLCSIGSSVSCGFLDLFDRLSMKHYDSFFVSLSLNKGYRYDKKTFAGSSANIQRNV